ncbi:MAG: PilX N-terminal domain-containing pilus assembly protein [Luteibacter sp.]
MRPRRLHQRGISLFVVMVMVLLTTLIVLWTARTALFNELVTGNDSDYQRALEAAQAMVRDAEFDIKGQRPDGSPCKTGPGYEGSCRETLIDAAAGKVFFPQNAEDFQDLEAALSGRSPPCVKGICLSGNTAAEFWRTDAGESGLDAMKSVAARYGEFTGAVATSAVGDPQLVSSSTRDANAWYWVEVLPYDVGAAVAPGPAQTFKPDTTAPYIYRITGIAQGLKSSTRAVVQTVFVWRKVDS